MLCPSFLAFMAFMTKLRPRAYDINDVKQWQYGCQKKRVDLRNSSRHISSYKLLVSWSKIENSYFDDFPLYFLRFPLYNVSPFPTLFPNSDFSSVFFYLSEMYSHILIQLSQNQKAFFQFFNTPYHPPTHPPQEHVLENGPEKWFFWLFSNYMFLESWKLVL